MLISIINIYGCGNIGDAAILSTIFKRLTDANREHVFNSLAVGISGVHIEKYRDGYHDSEFMNKLTKALLPAPISGVACLCNWLCKFQLLRLIHQLMISDIVIFGGGHLLHDHKWYVPFYVFVISFLCRIFDSKLVFFSVGISPLKTVWGKFFSRLAMKNAEMTIVRDPLSYDYLTRELRTKENVFTATDPVVLFPAENDGEHKKARAIGISICAWIKFEYIYRYESLDKPAFTEKWAEVINNLVDKYDTDIVLIPTMFPKDKEISQKIYETAAPRERIAIYDEGMDPFGAITKIRDLEFLISMRLHPVILASVAGTAFLALNYDFKVREYLKQLDAEESLLEIEELGTDIFYERFDKLYKRRDAFTGDMPDKLKVLQEKERQAFEMLNRFLH